MALRQHNLPGTQVWGNLLADATDQQDIAAASTRLPRGITAVMQALGVMDMQLTNTQGLLPLPLDDSAKAALRRMQERARVAGMDLVQLLLTGDIQQWEQLVTVSFQRGMSLHLETSTIKQQVVQEFRVLLLMGRKLVFPVQTAAVVRADVTMEVQVEGSSSGSARKCAVSLMFPGNCRTVVRLMEAWQEAQSQPSPVQSLLAAMCKSEGPPRGKQTAPGSACAAPAMPLQRVLSPALPWLPFSVWLLYVRNIGQEQGLEQPEEEQCEEGEYFTDEIQVDNLVDDMQRMFLDGQAGGVPLATSLSYLLQHRKRTEEADNAAEVGKAIELGMRTAYLSQPGVFLEGWSALTSSSSWECVSEPSQLLVLLRAAAFSLPTADTCWGGRLPLCWPDFMDKLLLEGALSSARSHYCTLQEPHDAVVQGLEQLLVYVDELARNGNVTSSFEGSAEMNAAADAAVAGPWQLLQRLVAKQARFRPFAERWLFEQQGSNTSWGQLLRRADAGYKGIYRDLMAAEPIVQADKVPEGPPSKWTFGGLVDCSDAAEVEAFISSQPELAFDAISNSLVRVPTFSPDKSALQLGMLLLVTTALPETELYATELYAGYSVPRVLPASLPKSFREHMKGLFDTVTTSKSTHSYFMDEDFVSEKLLLNKYKAVLFDRGGQPADSLCEQDLSRIEATLQDWLLQDKEHLLRTAVIPSVLEAARSHKKRSSAAGA